MTQALPKIVTFDEFIAWYPENSGVRYELHNGEIVEMSQPTGKHEKVKGFLVRKLSVEFDRLNLPYFIPNQAIVKPPARESGYFPDVLIVNDAALASEPLWEKSSTIINGASIPLVIEVVSTNWRDDYYLKLADYEEMGIPEYWVVDYAALGARKFIGNPKQPTFSLYQLINGEYQVTQFRSNDQIQSPTFPELNLTVEQIFIAG
ncbi:Uma2 family endonuclease [Tolypothrix sp. FACHB-123]|uniref:Uma2 family endonuclease n=1 Tax=Tolypothrix sp. FACHB-123 TaxID=2692868 RepID=UPI00168A275E|nr:Uma2 family endonuclease [Tolypothrix sp. FACHB-123]MBD2356022.1 Uma2 family endonuclease [Tolypothrix sp. FACHB-123]